MQNAFVYFENFLRNKWVTLIIQFPNSTYVKRSMKGIIVLTAADEARNLKQSQDKKVWGPLVQSVSAPDSSQDKPPNSVMVEEVLTQC